MDVAGVDAPDRCPVRRSGPVPPTSRAGPDDVHGVDVVRVRLPSIAAGLGRRHARRQVLQRFHVRRRTRIVEVPAGEQSRRPAHAARGRRPAAAARPPLSACVASFDSIRTRPCEIVCPLASAAALRIVTTDSIAMPLVAPSTNARALRDVAAHRDQPLQRLGPQRADQPRRPPAKRAVVGAPGRSSARRRSAGDSRR